MQQTTNDRYMTTCPELGMQPNSFPGSTNKLAINQVRALLSVINSLSYSKYATCLDPVLQRSAQVMRTLHYDVTTW